LVFRVAKAQRDEVVDYLNERELGSYAYKAKHLPVDVDGRMVDAYTFVADENHCHYAGDLALDEAARIIMEAEGVAGLNRDYLINTIRELEANGFVEPALHSLLRTVEELTGLIESGSGI
jgi:cation transport protein ChaC